MLFLTIVGTLFVSAYGQPYFLTNAKSDWKGVRAECQSRNGDLASFTTVADVGIIWDLCKSVIGGTRDMGCHIGYLDRGSGPTNDFYFVDGTEPFDALGLWEHRQPTAGHGYDHGCILPDYGVLYGLELVAVRPKGLGDCTQNAVWYGICLAEETDNSCESDDDCPDGEVCCHGPNKICHPPRQPKANSILSESLSEYDLAGNVKPTHVKAAPYNTNMYGYILLIGVIAFILINNIFIGFACLCKKNNTQYEKCNDINIS